MKRHGYHRTSTREQHLDRGITEVDRLGRNKQETLKELQYYRDMNVRVKILELPTTLMDLSKPDNAMEEGAWRVG